MKKHTWKIVGGVFVVCMGLAFWYASYAGEKANEGVVIENRVKGNTDAKVTLTEYADFQCPACAQFHPVLKSIYEEYSSQMAFEFKHFPLVSIHAFAVPAAKAAEAAGQQGKFYEMHDKLFENQGVWSKSPTPQAYFSQYAEELGLDVDLFKRHMRASLIEDHIQEQFDEAREKGLTGTPSFFLNGERLEFQTMDEFRSKIEAALGVGPATEDTSVETVSEPEVKFGI